jgi:hypothetical protein
MRWPTRPAQAEGRHGRRDRRSAGSPQKELIERAYRPAERLGLELGCQDEAGPYQAIPQGGPSWLSGERPWGAEAMPAPRVLLIWDNLKGHTSLDVPAAVGARRRRVAAAEASGPELRVSAGMTYGNPQAWPGGTLRDGGGDGAGAQAFREMRTWLRTFDRAQTKSQHDGKR